jgi:hypothetical protein
VRKLNVSSPESLAKLAKVFEQEGGRRPVEKARQARLAVKAKK